MIKKENTILSRLNKKVGDKITYKSSVDNSYLVGVIGEIENDRFYVFSNDSMFDGSRGDIDPEDFGCDYSYCLMNKFTKEEDLERELRTCYKRNLSAKYLNGYEGET
jgi:hypothetical protein